MGLKRILTFIFAVGISLAAATHQWGDSAHTMGMIAAGGGKVRHPAFFEGNHRRYTMIVTAKVVPPYRGDARVVLEGASPMDYELMAAAPVVDFKLKSRPELRGDTFFGLKPRDRLALWVRMTPSASGPANRFTLSFQDLQDSETLLTVPVIFKEPGEQEHAGPGKH